MGNIHDFCHLLLFSYTQNSFLMIVELRTINNVSRLPGNIFLFITSHIAAHTWNLRSYRSWGCSSVLLLRTLNDSQNQKFWRDLGALFARTEAWSNCRREVLNPKRACYHRELADPSFHSRQGLFQLWGREWGRSHSKYEEVSGHLSCLSIIS